MLHEILNWVSANVEEMEIGLVMICCSIIIVEGVNQIFEILADLWHKEKLKLFEEGFDRGWDDALAYVEREAVVIYEPLAQIEWQNGDGSWTIKPVWSEEDWTIEDDVEARKEVI